MAQFLFVDHFLNVDDAPPRKGGGTVLGPAKKSFPLGGGLSADTPLLSVRAGDHPRAGGNSRGFFCRSLG